jgi:dsDNA-specific endonuclease/ATPase MutS2
VDLAALEYPAIVARLVAATSTPQGAALAAALEPSADREEVERRHQIAAEALALEELPLVGIHDVTEAATLAERGGTLQADALRRVASTIRGAITARAAAAGGLLGEIAERIDPSLATVADEI